MLRPILLLIVLSFSVHQVDAQKKMKKAAKKAASDMCDCFGGIMDELDLHPELIKMVYDMDQYGQEEAQNRLTQTLLTADQELVDRIVADTEKMQSIGGRLETDCNYIKEKYTKYDSDPDFEKYLIESMSKLESCKLVYTFMKIGTSK